jgi:methyl-accepting chemotaxis protein
MREDQAAAVTRTRRRTPLGIQVLAGLSGLLALLLVSMLVAIVLVVGLRRDQTALSDRGVPYANAVAEAALQAKAIANDQRGFLMTGDLMFIHEVDHRVDDARRAFDTAGFAAGSSNQRQAVSAARAGFEQWLQAVRTEFASFQNGDRQAAVAASLGPDRDLRKSYEQLLADAQAQADGSLQSASNSAAAAASRSIQILVACLLVALAIGVAVASWLMRSVALPLFRLATLLMPDA